MRMHSWFGTRVVVLMPTRDSMLMRAFDGWTNQVGENGHSEGGCHTPEQIRDGNKPPPPSAFWPSKAAHFTINRRLRPQIYLRSGSPPIEKRQKVTSVESILRGTQRITEFVQSS